MKHLRHTIFVVLALCLGGCNDDVFVDPITPESYSYTLEGEGAECVVNFASGGWDYLWISTPQASSDAPSYYFDVRDPHGAVITQGQSRSARLEGRGYVRVSDEETSIYFMRDKRDRVLVHAESLPKRTIRLQMAVHSVSGLNECVQMCFKP